MALQCVFCVPTFLVLMMKHEEGRNQNLIKLQTSVHLTENVCVLSKFPVNLLKKWLCKKKEKRCNSVENGVPLIEIGSFREPDYLQCIYAVRTT